MKRWYADARFLELRMSGRTVTGGLQFERSVVRAGDRFSSRKRYASVITVMPVPRRRCVRRWTIYGGHR